MVEESPPRDAGQTGATPDGAAAWRLPILYRDEHLVAVNKPSGLLVHRSSISRDRDFALQRVRNQLGRRVYPVHRLDRGTSGLLLFALTPEADRVTSMDFQEGRVKKRYLLVVRGYTDPEGEIDHALKTEDKSRTRDALTRYRRLATTEIDEPVGRYATARYSLVEAVPETGRRHQLRRHFNHIGHPVVGDTTHGDGRHNRFFRHRLDSHRLLLHARSLNLKHPIRGDAMCLTAPLPPELVILLDRLGWGTADACNGPESQ